MKAVSPKSSAVDKNASKKVEQTRVRKAAVRPKRHPVIETLWARAAEENADFIYRHLDQAMIFDSKVHLHKFAMRDLPAEGLLLEFGVFKASSLNRFADILTERNDPRTIYGFDAFEGLSEDWAGTGIPKLDTFSLQGNLPEVRPNAMLVKGWIDQTLPGFMENHPGNIAFLHIDTDTYTPAKLILDLCHDRLIPGSLVLFDELLGYPGWRYGEYKALTETIPEDRYEFLGFSGYQVLVRIL